MTDAIGGYAADALRGVGLVDPRDEVLLEALGGGVSNDVVIVRSGDTGYVAKRALARLRVKDQWDAPVTRSFTEATALHWAATIQPQAVPDVLAIDRANHVIVESLAPADYVNWKSLLLSAEVEPAVGGRLGELLASWHLASAQDAELLALFDSREAFSQLRIHPFYEVAAERNGTVAASLSTLVEHMAERHLVLVHGDFSPKNVLVTRAPKPGVWVIDWEVAHTGDPVFDVAFMLHHLLCKAISRPESRVLLHRTGDLFLSNYYSAVGDMLGPFDARYLAAHTAALLLARVDGKSPVEYFDDNQKYAARRIALAALSSDQTDVSELWRSLDD
jgi:5-methylthioribose kinase